LIENIQFYTNAKKATNLRLVMSPKLVAFAIFLFIE